MNELEFPPPVRYLSAFLTVGQLHLLVMFGSASILHQDFFVFQEGWQEAFGVGDEGARILRALICLVGSLGLGVSGHSWMDAAASGSSGSSSCSPGGWHPPPEQGVLSSSPVDSKSKAYRISLRLIKGAMHFWSSHTALQGTLVHAPDLSVQHCSAQLRPGFSPVSQSRSPWCWRHQHGAGNHEDTACRNRVKHPTNLRPPVGGWQPEGQSLPLSKVQGLRFVEVFRYGVSSEGTPHDEVLDGPQFPFTSKGGLKPYPSASGSIGKGGSLVPASL